ncbi:MAG: ribonuclease P protein component [Corallococcus sp.]|nr:ribonuclease P protein component [Corallococcus sp.]
MQAKYRLKKNYQYNYVYKHAESVSDGYFAVLYCKNKSKQSKIGFSVSKKYGKAVKRNRLRRQMKSAAAMFAANLNEGFNIVILPRRKSAYKFDVIVNSLCELFQKAGLL